MWTTLTRWGGVHADEDVNEVRVLTCDGFPLGQIPGGLDRIVQVRGVARP